MKESLSYGVFSGRELVPLVSIVYVLPYIFFSLYFSQYADRDSKTLMLRKLKVIESSIVILAGFAMYSSYLIFMLLSLMCFGIYASVVGPLKLSMIAEIVDEDSILEANSLIQATMFVTSLLAIVTSNYLFNDLTLNHLMWFYLIPSLVSTFYTMNIEMIKPIKPDLEIQKNIFSLTLKTVREMYRVKGIMSYVLNVSLFWLMAGVLVAVIPPYIGLFTNNNIYISLFLCLISIGIAFGAYMYQNFFDYIEKGALTFFSALVCLFFFDLYLLGLDRLNWTDWWWLRVFFDFSCLSIFSGMILVAFYTSLQTETTDDNRSFIIAGTNVVSSCAMIFSSMIVLGSYIYEYEVLDVLMFLFFIMLFNTVVIYRTFPVHFYQYICFLGSKLFYRTTVVGSENIPKKGPYIIICNHVSFIDWLFIAGASKLPIRFVMYFAFSNFATSWFFRDGKVILISEKGLKRNVLLKAFKDIDSALSNSEVVGYFPEGSITRTGEMVTFQKGIMKILEKNDVPVLPMRLDGLWGSMFSRSRDKRFSLRRRRVTLTIGEFIKRPESCDDLYKRVTKLK